MQAGLIHRHFNAIVFGLTVIGIFVVQISC